MIKLVSQADGADPTRPSRGRAAFVVHQMYGRCPRVPLEVESLARLFTEVDVFCLRAPREPALESRGGIRIHRLPLQHRRSNHPIGYLAEYTVFGCMAAASLLAESRRGRYRLLHVHAPPEILVFSGAWLRLSRTRIVLDLQDLVPELYMSRFGAARGSFSVRFAYWVERLCSRRADLILTASKPFMRRLRDNGVDASRVEWMLNAPDRSRFGIEHRNAGLPRPDDGFTVINHGGYFERYGLDVAVRAAALARDRVSRLSLDMYGEGDFKKRLIDLVEELNLTDVVSLHGWVSPSAIPSIVARANLGVVPNRPDPHIDLAVPTKALEYVALGVPVAATRTPVLQELFDEHCIIYFDDAAGLAERIVWASRHPEELAAMASRALRVLESLGSHSVETRYPALISDLMGRRY